MGKAPSGRIFVERAEQHKEEIDSRIKRIFPNADTSKFLSEIDRNGDVIIKLGRSNRKEYHIIDENGELLIDTEKGKFPRTLRNALGSSVFEIIAEEDGGIERAKVRNEELDKEIPNAVGEDKKRMMEERERNQRVINVGEQRIEALNERLSLRQRIKEIFRKYGFTVIAVSTAIATVIGVIVSNLKVGLAKVAQGVGNGLKELGKKLGEILPGMVGAIASFIFQTAGEVIGFLAKNAWLLIVGLIVFAVEQFKNKKK